MTSTLSLTRRHAVRAAAGLALATTMLVGTAPSSWSEPTAEAVDAIDSRYTTFGGAASLLGQPLADAVDVTGGAARDYQGGAIYYSPTSGARVMYGAILDRYRALGGPDGELGFPTNDESATGDGTGRFNDFTTPGGAALYWSPQWGASLLKGRVLEAWRQSGAERGPFGYPAADTTVVDGVQTGKFVGPTGTEIQWSQAGGLVTVPAELAATISGAALPATTSAAPSTLKASPTTSVSSSGSGALADLKGKISRHWWLIPAALGALAVLAALLRLLRRRPAASRKSKTTTATVKPATASKKLPDRAAPTRIDPEPPTAKIDLPPRETGLGVSRPVPPRPTPPPPPVPPRPVPPAPSPEPPLDQARPLMPEPPPATPPPWTQRSRQPAPPPPPTTPPTTPQPPPVPPSPPLSPAATFAPPVPPPAPAPLTAPRSAPAPMEIKTEPAAEDLSAVIRYESHEPADAAIEVTYQNNAVGDHQASASDKSDSVPD